jgi:hypothetical protein
MKQIVAIMVPFVSRLHDLHQDGATFFVHPSAIVYDPAGARLDEIEATSAPELPHDRACLAPEQRQAVPPRGDARASVFACGAILYEMATGDPIGPGMRRPSEVVRAIPEQFEILLGKALVGAAASRPADLGALAHALHHCAPLASIPPPTADESHLDHDTDFEVDVSLSMLPPAPRRGQAGVVVAPPPAPSLTGTGTTGRLAELKARLEADPRPRYVVIKDGMDHGPFTAVELLHQIAVGSFEPGHSLRDTLSKDERSIADWEEFAPFAEQARLSQEVASERKELEAGVQAEKHRAHYKMLGGGAVVLLAAAAFAGWYFRTRHAAQDDLTVSGDKARSIDFEGGLKGAKKSGPGSGKWRGGWGKGSPGQGGGSAAGSHPVIPGGLSCEGARSRYVEEYNMGGDGTPPDLSAGQFGAVLNSGTYLNSCGVPPSTAVSICAAVQNGHAVGVTVTVNPPNGSIAGCIAGQIRSMSFPSHPRLDVTTTVFKPQ